MIEARAIEVAIIGGGITGLTLALGLQKRNTNFHIYERAQSLREIGAGIGFTPNAERAMLALDPRIHEAFKSVASKNASDWFQWVDGFSGVNNDKDTVKEDLLFNMYLGERGFEGCHRAQFLKELVNHLPQGCVTFGACLDTIIDQGENERILLKFHNGTIAEADLVIGCDGIRSRVRQLILGENNPASYPAYTHKKAYRGLIPMEKALPALGESKVNTRLMHLGPDAHTLTFPVAGGKLMNVVAFVTDPGEWPYTEKLSAPAEKKSAIEGFSKFGGAVRTIMNLLPEDLDEWAIFDTYDHPASTYYHGRICIAGDAAHASSPHHGAGAGAGIEDVTVLATVIEVAQTTLLESPDKSRSGVLNAALATYNAVRLERSQWLVESSRILGEIYEWQYKPTGRDKKKCEEEVYWRSHKIWDYDIGQMLQETTEYYKQRVGA
ncbi:monoxygenase, putative [Talaromyces stipitatus ATCC 10500]|uniref:Monoxygenase, putative n=1 Tax=Talaromyces stipitatus (strain ATCC 10500 / CBS 375.48 / QM 6759 / NRRL 1006) TaxID=441959 RepID=B8LV27_TALSN|nr:monooxygenase, putative [Talaromyces stipitatus ATCC 10500]EED22648.1 monoxygenase, putative [Talaromyces stipitatus ATCC 10500]